MDINITDLYPLENYATFDRIRPLVWSNAAILHACHYIAAIHGEKLSYADILKEFLEVGSIRSVIALTYGAAKAAHDRMNVFWFARIYNEKYINECIDSAVAGIAAYLPEPEIKDSGKNLDESYPDTQKEISKQKDKYQYDWGYWFWFAKSKLNMTADEFAAATQRSIYEQYKRYWTDHGHDMISKDDGSWL